MSDTAELPEPKIRFSTCFRCGNLRSVENMRTTLLPDYRCCKAPCGDADLRHLVELERLADEICELDVPDDVWPQMLVRVERMVEIAKQLLNPPEGV